MRWLSNNWHNFHKNNASHILCPVHNKNSISCCILFSCKCSKLLSCLILWLGGQFIFMQCWFCSCTPNSHISLNIIHRFGSICSTISGIMCFYSCMTLVMPGECYWIDLYFGYSPDLNRSCFHYYLDYDCPVICLFWFPRIYCNRSLWCTFSFWPKNTDIDTRNNYHNNCTHGQSRSSSHFLHRHPSFAFGYLEERTDNFYPSWTGYMRCVWSYDFLVFSRSITTAQIYLTCGYPPQCSLHYEIWDMHLLY